MWRERLGWSMGPACTGGGNSLSSLAGELRYACLSENVGRLETLFRMITEMDETSADAWYGLGMLCMHRGRLEDAYDYLSEFVAVAGEDREAEDVEGLLCFLDRLMSGGEELDLEVFADIDERLLRRYYDPGDLDVPRTELQGFTLREAAGTMAGKETILELIREHEGFKRAALERGLKAVFQGAPL